MLELEIKENLPIVVEVKSGDSSVKFEFRPCTHQDVAYAATILKQTDVTGELTALDRDSVVKHVFLSLTKIDGEIRATTGEEITVEKLRELANQGKIQATFANKITIPWASAIIEAQGFLAEALKKAQVSEQE